MVGDSGGAREALVDGETGVLVDGRGASVADAVATCSPTPSVPRPWGGRPRPRPARPHVARDRRASRRLAAPGGRDRLSSVPGEGGVPSGRERRATLPGVRRAGQPGCRVLRPVLHQPPRAPARAARRVAGDAEAMPPPPIAGRPRRPPARPPPGAVGASWPCPACGAQPHRAGGLRALRHPVRRRDAPRHAPRGRPEKALRRSLIYPGLGHASSAVGSTASRAARSSRSPLFILIILPFSGVPTSPLTILAGVLALYLLMALYPVYPVGSAYEAYRIAQGRTTPVTVSRALAVGRPWGSSCCRWVLLALTVASVASR